MKVKSAGLLAAGIANRMNEGYFPKSLIPVGNLSPILYHLLNLKKIGINNVVIVINKKSSILREYLGNGNQFSMKIDYIEDDEKLDTGGDLKQLLSKINEDFLLISCDTIIEVDYSILIDKFKQDSFLLFKKESNGKYFFGQNNKLYNASNTTNENERVSFAGIGVFQRKSLDEYFPEGKNNFPLSYVLKELAGKGKLFGQTTTSPIFNLNSYDNFCQANDYFLQRENLIEKFCFSQKIKTIIFDLDFTLFDSSDIVVDGINYSCEKLNIAKLSRKEIYEKTKFKFPRNEVIKLGKSLTSDINKQQQFCDYYYEYIKDKYPKLYPSALELLYFLNSQKLTLGIITSKTRSLCIETLKFLKIDHLFKEIICYNDVEKPKPNEESFIKICEKFNVSTDDCIYIGDDINDAIPCVKCSMIFFGVTTTLSKEDFLPYKQYFIFDGLNQIESFFKQLCLFRSYTSRYPLGVKNLIIDSESILPKTKYLSQEIKKNMIDGMKLLLSADMDSLENMKVLKEEMLLFRKNIEDVIKNNKKIHFFGCGSSGRLLVMVERMMRLNNMDVKDYTFNISGGDTTIPRSFSDFEDNPEYGVRQLKEVGFSDGDMVVTVSGSGTAPFLLDILYYAVNNSSAKHYAIFCNPLDQLKKRCEESKIFMNKELFSKINWFSIPSGPMSITGSTRLQATLVMTIVVGCLTMKYDLIEVIDNILLYLKDIDFSDLQQLVLDEKNIYERGEKIVYNTYEDLTFITMMDTTERTATFNLSPFKNDYDPESQPYSLCYLHIDNTNSSEEAINKLFLRKPRLLEWDDYPKTKEQYFYGFNFSKYDKNIYTNIMDISYDKNNQLLIFKYKDHNFSFKCPKDNELVFQMVFKTIINIYSNTVMALMDYYRNNIMTNLTACNTKLIGRICYFIEEFSTFSYHEISRIVFDLVLRLIPGQSIINNCLNYIDFKIYANDLNNKIFKDISMNSFILQKLFEEKISVQKISQIKGGAGDNKYFRILFQKFYGQDKIMSQLNTNESYILAYSNTNFKKDSNYFKVANIYNKEGIKVPKIFYQDNNETFLILEECGEQITKFINEDINLIHQKKIIDILINIQHIKNDEINEYPKNLILSEIRIFLDNFIKEFLKIELNEEETRFLENLFIEVSDYLSNLQTKVTCHKDFNTSNILFKNDNYYIIDFQSSLKYSRFYDLISFLLDDRINFNKKYFDKGLDYYITNQKEIQKDLNEIKYCILHRNFHTLGLFSKFYLEGKLNYRESIENSFLILNEFSKEFKINELISILNKYPLKFPQILPNFDKFCLKEDLSNKISKYDFIIITGSSSSGKTSLVKHLANKFNIDYLSFDEMLISNLNEDIKNKLDKNNYDYLYNLFNDDLYYFVRHADCEKKNPFIKTFADSHKDDWEKIKELLIDINKNLLNGEENKKLCLKKLEYIMDENKKLNKKLFIDIAYANDNELSLFEKFNSYVIFSFIPINVLLSTIKKRNIDALKRNKPKEYRHIIYVLYCYLKYYIDGNGKIIDEIDENQFNLILKEIPVIDPYYQGYHKNDFRNINILNQFKFPIKCYLPFVKYLDYKNLDLVSLNE